MHKKPKTTKSNITRRPQVSGVQSGVRKGLYNRYLCDDACLRAVFSFKVSLYILMTQYAKKVTPEEMGS